jgi:hypothetical protein
MKYRSKINNNYIIKLTRYDNSYLISVKNKKYYNNYIDIGFINKFFVSEEEIKELKYNTYIIQAYDEILKERYDIEVY